MQSIVVKSTKANVTALVLWSIAKTESTRDSGLKTNGRAKAWKSTATPTGMKAISKKEKLTAKVFTTGQTERSMMVNGKTE